MERGNEGGEARESAADSVHLHLKETPRRPIASVVDHVVGAMDAEHFVLDSASASHLAENLHQSTSKFVLNPRRPLSTRSYKKTATIVRNIPGKTIKKKIGVLGDGVGHSV